MRHALEPDHLATVSTLATLEKSPRRVAVLGLWWGLGHALALLGLAGGLALLERQLSPRWMSGFELGVALLLLLLGARALHSAWRQPQLGPPLLHAHGETRHHHGGPAAHLHVGRWTMARRPLLIGTVHGLAGSGSLTALALASAVFTAAAPTLAHAQASTPAAPAAVSGPPTTASGVPIPQRVQRSRAVTMTRFVRVFTDLEYDLIDALRAEDKSALDKLVAAADALIARAAPGARLCGVGCGLDDQLHHFGASGTSD